MTIGGDWRNRRDARARKAVPDFVRYTPLIWKFPVKTPGKMPEKLLVAVGRLNYAAFPHYRDD